MLIFRFITAATIFGILFFSVGKTFAQQGSASGSQGEQCSRGDKFIIDMRKDFGPIRDQDNIGWCYAYTASDLLGQYFLQKKIGPDPREVKNQLSPIAAAMNYDQWDRRKVLQSIVGLENSNRTIKPGTEEEPEGGVTQNTLWRMLKSPICRESQVSSRDTFLSDSNLGIQNGSELDLKVYNYFDDPTHENLCQASMSLQGLFRQLQVPEIAKILAQYKTSDPMMTLISKSCGSETIPDALVPNVVLSSSTSATGDDVLPEVDKVLTSGRAVEASINANIFDKFKGGKVDNHSILLVGRRLNCETKKVEYLVRNSWAKNGCNFKTATYGISASGSQKSQIMNCSQSCSENQDFNNCFQGCNGDQLSLNTEKPDSFSCTTDGYFVVGKEFIGSTVGEVTYLKDKN